MKLNRNLLKQALKVAQSTKAQFPVNGSLKVLAERGLGQIVGHQYRIDRPTRLALREWLKNEGVNWMTPISNFSGDRIDIARHVTNEKTAPAPGPNSRILIAALGTGVQLNGQPLPYMEGAFVSIPKADIQHIDARCLLLVENKQAFESLFKVQGDYCRDGILAVYRGDPSAPYGQQWVCAAVDAFGIPLAAYMDFDPSGLSMGLSCGASSLLLPKPEALSHLEGSAQDFRNQHLQWEALRGGEGYTDVLAPWVHYLGCRRASFTQERLIAHNIRHTWIDLPKEGPDDH